MKQWLLILTVCFAASGVRAADDTDREWERSLNAARQRLAQAARELATLQRRRLQDSANYLTAAGGEGDRAIIGISLSGNPDDKPGVMVVGVAPKSPAATAGMQSGDVITSIGGVALDDVRGREAVKKLLDTMRKINPGDDVALEYRRGDIQRRVTLVTQGYTEDAAIDWSMEGGPSYDVFAEAPADSQIFGHWGDLAMVSLSPGLGEYFGTHEGVLVVHSPDSLPLRDGDVLVSVSGQGLTDAMQAVQLLSLYQPGEVIDVEVLRQGKSLALEFERNAAQAAQVERIVPGQKMRVQRARPVQ